MRGGYNNFKVIIRNIMNLKGDKVLLREIELDDMEFLKNMLNDIEIEKNVVGWAFPVSSYEQEQWYKNNIGNKKDIRYIIEVDGKRIGMATLQDIDWKNRKASHGIKLTMGEEFRGKGYGTDTVKTIMKYAFEELQLNRLYGSILEYNIASRKLYEKCGWKVEGIYRESIYKNNKYNDEILVSILKKDYEERNK